MIHTPTTRTKYVRSMLVKQILYRYFKEPFDVELAVVCSSGTIQ